MKFQDEYKLYIIFIIIFTVKCMPHEMDLTFIGCKTYGVLEEISRCNSLTQPLADAITKMTDYEKRDITGALSRRWNLQLQIIVCYRYIFAEMLTQHN